MFSRVCNSAWVTDDLFTENYFLWRSSVRFARVKSSNKKQRVTNSLEQKKSATVLVADFFYYLKIVLSSNQFSNQLIPMKSLLKLFSAIVLFTIANSPITSKAQDVMTPDLLWRLGRVGAECVSADGKNVVFGVSIPDVNENKSKRFVSM